MKLKSHVCQCEGCRSVDSVPAEGNQSVTACYSLSTWHNDFQATCEAVKLCVLHEISQCSLHFAQDRSEDQCGVYLEVCSSWLTGVHVSAVNNTFSLSVFPARQLCVISGHSRGETVTPTWRLSADKPTDPLQTAASDRLLPQCTEGIMTHTHNVHTKDLWFTDFTGVFFNQVVSFHSNTS